MHGNKQTIETQTNQLNGVVPSNGQSTYAKSTADTGKMAFSAMKVVRAPLCFTDSMIEMFHKTLKIT